MMKVISVVTGSRADFGLLEEVISRISDSPNLELELIVTGSHLSDSFGRTGNQIMTLGYANVTEISINVEIKSETELTIAIGGLVQKIATHYSTRKPSLTLVLGDRYEMLGVALACATLGIPLAHIHGGEITTGSKDDMYRHAITKLASLHFVATPEFQKRVIGMGEDPKKVFVVGGLGVDSISRLKILTRQEIESNLGVSLESYYALVTYHPDSINPENSLDQLRTVIKSTESFPDVQFLVTGANADFYGNELNQFVKESSIKNRNLFFFDSVGQQNYLSLLAGAMFVLGNSSSGLLEAPCFKVATINVGTRQDGRPRASSVIDVECDETQIVNGIQSVIAHAEVLSLQSIDNPYGNPGASKKIADILSTYDFEALLPKRFLDAN
jgi:GDP/UDP-N,N'-diacetylbacillosamine 2-epimerase (hydrolysing)